MTHSNAEARMHLEVTEVTNTAAWLCVCVCACQHSAWFHLFFLISCLDLSDKPTKHQWPFQKSSCGEFPLKDAIKENMF